MAVNDEVKRGSEKSEPEESPSEGSAGRALSEESAGGEPNGEALVRRESDALAAPTEEDETYDVAPVASPAQLGARRFVYAFYFAGAIAIAFLLSKFADLGWQRLQTYTPSIGEPRDDVVLPVAAIIGAGTATYYWYRTSARRLTEEVASEMSKVTWPTRTEVTNGTVVVIVTTVVSTVFFALMDKFWGFVTNLVYGGT
jgi:preprotein translocase subunit SecE